MKKTFTKKGENELFVEKALKIQIFLNYIRGAGGNLTLSRRRYLPEVTQKNMRNFMKHTRILYIITDYSMYI